MLSHIILTTILSGESGEHYHYSFCTHRVTISLSGYDITYMLMVEPGLLDESYAFLLLPRDEFDVQKHRLYFKISTRWINFDG